MTRFHAEIEPMQAESQAKVARLRTRKRLPIPVQSSYPAQPGGICSNSSVLTQVLSRIALTAL